MLSLVYRRIQFHKFLICLTLAVGCIDRSSLEVAASQLLQPNDYISDNYWTCFETKNVSWSLDGYEVDEQGDDAGEIEYGTLAITAVRGKRRYLYTFNHGVVRSVSEEVASALNRITQNEPILCIASWFISEIDSSENDYDYLANFLRAKTKKGYAAYELSYVQHL